MPGGRRTSKSSAFKHHAHVSDDRHSCEIPTQPQVVPPKHIPIPDIPPSSDLYFEIDALTFCLVAMIAQYINLYRSVFWLPYSHTDSAVNYYLIDYYVVIFNLIMVGRRLPPCLLKQVCFFCLPVAYHSTCAFFIRALMTVALIPALACCTYNIIIEHGVMSILCLGYPTVVYIILFGPTTLPLLELNNSVPERSSGAKGKSSGNGKNLPSVNHVCSMSAEAIREEVEVLKSDFNARLKQVLFNSLLVTYYASFVPCCFVQSTLYFERHWIGQHITFTWLSCFTLYASHCFPVRYCDVLHRAALHLGRWQRVEIKNMHVPYSMWSESAMWNQGALVKQSKELFKAEGISNAAEPGNLAHSRFYAVFRNPSTPVKFLWAVQLLLLLAQMFVLSKSYSWNDLISIELLILVNCKTLYGITKIYFVTRKIYYEEKMLLLKFSN